VRVRRRSVRGRPGRPDGRATIGRDTLPPVARLSYPRSAGPRPEALPPAERTVGQVVAEAIRLYGGHFLPSLALGSPAAAIVALAAWTTGPAQAGAILVAGSGLSAWALVRAVRIAYPDAASNAAALAFGVGVVAFLPVLASRLVVFPGIYLIALAWLAATIFAVPVVLVEGAPAGAALARSTRLARADAVHALGALATLTITIVLTALVLTFLLRGFGDQGIRVAAVLALLIVTPLFFLGAAVLYADQAARDARDVKVDPND
jgi:hypothetical protein